MKNIFLQKGDRDALQNHFKHCHAGYPRQCESQTLLKDGQNIFIRPIRPEDAPLLIELAATLSERTIYRRFFSPLRTLPYSMLPDLRKSITTEKWPLRQWRQSTTQKNCLGLPALSMIPVKPAVNLPCLWGTSGRAKALVLGC